MPKEVGYSLDPELSDDEAAFLWRLAGGGGVWY